MLAAECVEQQAIVVVVFEDISASAIPSRDQGG
jgi:hypothetical protein